MTKINEKMTARRGVLRAGLAMFAAGGLATGAMATGAMAAERVGPQRFAQATDKLAQNLVQYQTTPKDGAKCSGCVNFEAPNACKIVAGTINPEGWCVAYAPKGA